MAQVLKLDDPIHQGAESLLPWFVNGTLYGEELARVQRHLGECARCQREAEWLREVQTAYRETEFAPDALQSFNRLRTELDKRSLVVGIGQLWRRHVGRYWKRAETWAKWTIVLQFALLLGVTALVVAGRQDAPYRTLGAAPTAPEGNVVVVFDPATPEAQLRRILQAVDARIVNGPTGNAAYVLRVSVAQEEHALQTLHAEHAVLLAQRLGDARQP